MTRLIDADALDKRIYNDIPISVFGSIKKMAAVREIIAEAPTVDANHIADDGKKVDAVPVVRCKDCRWWCTDCMPKEVGWCDATVNRSTYEDWFCADGERKDDADN